MIPALKDAGLDQGQVGIYSVDGSNQAVRAMKEGKAFRATACLYPKLLGEMAAKTMIAHLNGKEPQTKFIHMGTGLLTWEDVQAGKGPSDVIPKGEPMFWEGAAPILPTRDWEWVLSRK